jgi:hypothetical protein
VPCPAGGVGDDRAPKSLRFALTFNNCYKIEDCSKTFLNWYQFAVVTFNMGIGFVLLVDRPTSRRIC